MSKFMLIVYIEYLMPVTFISILLLLTLNVLTLSKDFYIHCSLSYVKPQFQEICAIVSLDPKTWIHSAGGGMLM